MNNNQILALIFLRTYAVASIVSGLNSGLGIFAQLKSDISVPALFSLFAYSSGIPIGVGLILWAVSRPLARKMVAEGKNDPTSGSAISPEAAQRAAATLVGLYMFITGMVGVVRAVAGYFANFFLSQLFGQLLPNVATIATLVVSTFQTLFALWILMDSDHVLTIFGGLRPKPEQPQAHTG